MKRLVMLSIMELLLISSIIAQDQESPTGKLHRDFQMCN
jgi:hypothetical protein